MTISRLSRELVIVEHKDRQATFINPSFICMAAWAMQVQGTLK